MSIGRGPRRSALRHRPTTWGRSQKAVSRPSLRTRSSMAVTWLADVRRAFRQGVHAAMRESGQSPFLPLPQSAECDAKGGKRPFTGSGSGVGILWRSRTYHRHRYGVLISHCRSSIRAGSCHFREAIFRFAHGRMPPRLSYAGKSRRLDPSTSLALRGSAKACSEKARELKPGSSSRPRFSLSIARAARPACAKAIA